MPFVDLDYHLDSNVNGLMKTSLVNGTIIMDVPWYSSANCKGRCIYRVTEYDNSYSSWQDSGEPFDCEMVHVKCHVFLFYLFPYGYERVHSQVMAKNKTGLEPPEKEKKYNIFVILVDSTAHSQAHRNLPKTLHFLKQQFSAVTFPFVNKVGTNSRPNGFPLYFGMQLGFYANVCAGKTVENIGNQPADWIDTCDVPLDGYRGILDDMKEQGYRTLYSDDGPISFYTAPNCTGFKKEVADHTLMPLMREISDNNKKLMLTYRLYDMQRYPNPARTVLLLDYFEQFIRAYPEEPKFGWIWSTDLSHDKQFESIAMDTILYKFLVNNLDQFDDSFVFLMGDHGLQYGSVLNTKTAQLDLNNPALTISVPKALRETGILEMLKKNSGSLQTHFDTRATWLDIAKVMNELRVNKVSDTSEYVICDLNGWPFALPTWPCCSQCFSRSTRYTACPMSTPMLISKCKVGPIKLISIGMLDGRTVYIGGFRLPRRCSKKFHRNSSEAILMGRRVIAEANNILFKFNAHNAEVCGKWIFSHVVSLQGVKPVNETGFYHITVGVSAPYEKALFETMISVKKNGELEVGPIDRRDQYGNRGHCATPSKLCHCV